MVGAAAALRNNVVDGEIAERELTAALVAAGLLLAEWDVRFLAVRHRRVDVGRSRAGEGSGRDYPSPSSSLRSITSTIEVGSMLFRRPRLL